MVSVNVNGIQLSIDGFLKDKLDNVKKIIAKNFDAVILIDGKERIGKSTLALTIGTYLYPNLSEKNIAIDSQDSVRKLDKLPDRSLLIIDEGSLIFSSKDTMRTEQRHLIKILNVIGQKNMTLIIVLPSFFDLTKYIAYERSRFLLHCYSPDGFQRGRFCYFGTRKLRRLYENGKKYFGSYSRPKADFAGTFTDYKPTWYEQYLKKKRQTLTAAITGSIKQESVLDTKDLLKNLVVNFKRNYPKISLEDLGKGFDMSSRTIKRYMKEVKKSDSDSGSAGSKYILIGSGMFKKEIEPTDEENDAITEGNPAE